MTDFVSYATSRYCLDEEQTKLLAEFHKHVWKDCKIETVGQLTEYENLYLQYSEKFDFVYDTEVDEFGFVDMNDGKACLLSKGRFEQLSKNLSTSEFATKSREYGLSDLEIVVLLSFLADISGLYRKDGYYHAIPPFVLSICESLNTGISKLPAYSKQVVRACNCYDKSDFAVGDVYRPGFCLTTSADLSWENKSENRYRIQPLDATKTKARKVFALNSNSEQQVTFLQDAAFRITAINEWSEGKKEFVMNEI